MYAAAYIAVATIALAGCGGKGLTVDFDVEPGCAVQAASLDIGVTVWPSAETKREVDPAAAFFAGSRHVLVTPPAGTTMVTLVVSALDGGGVQVGAASATVMTAMMGASVPGAYSAKMALGSCRTDDGGADAATAFDLAADAPPPDLGALDAAAPVDAATD